MELSTVVEQLQSCSADAVSQKRDRELPCSSFPYSFLFYHVERVVYSLIVSVISKVLILILY